MTPSVELLTPTIGAEVTGIDLGAVEESMLEFVHAALLDHLVLFFRDQHLTPDAQRRVMQRVTIGGGVPTGPTTERLLANAGHGVASAPSSSKGNGDDET